MLLEVSVSSITKINEDVFQTEVIESPTPVVVDFSAVWCGPCKMLDPVVEQLAGEWGDKVKVVKVDVDHNPNIAMQFQVMSVPTLMLFVDGQPKERLIGFRPKKHIERTFTPHLV